MRSPRSTGRHSAARAVIDQIYDAIGLERKKNKGTAATNRCCPKSLTAREDAYMKEGMQENRQRKTTPTKTKRGSGREEAGRERSTWKGMEYMQEMVPY